MRTTMKFLTMITLSLFIVIATTSCDGEDGAPGPQGVAGVDGQDGADGVDGVDGNANVIASDWFAATYTSPFPERKQYDIPAPEVNQDVRDSSVILVYGKFNNEIWGIPTAFPFLNETYNFMCFTTDGIITIFCDASDGTSAMGTPYIQEYRYVIIPSTTARNSIDYTSMSYQEVVDYFGLDY